MSCICAHAYAYLLTGLMQITQSYILVWVYLSCTVARTFEANHYASVKQRGHSRKIVLRLCTQETRHSPAVEGPISL